MEFTSRYRWTSTLILATTMRFSPHTKERESLHKCKLTKGEENAWTWSMEDEIKPPGVFTGFLCWKNSQKNWVIRPFRSVQLIQIISCRLHGGLFCLWIENCFCRLSLTEWFCFSVNSKLFLPGFLSQIAPLQATVVVLSLYQYSQLVLLLLSWSPCF